VDGVVALDQFGLERLLEVLGPVDVREYAERVGADNLQASLDRYVHAGDGNDELGRKQFTAALSAAVLDGVLDAPRSKLPAMIRAVRRALDEQHLLVAVWDPEAADLLARRRWNGALIPAARDALMVVDTDIVASKQGQSVSRDVAYSVDLGGGVPPHARTVVTYTNRSHRLERPNVSYVPEYRTFVRIYAPSGAELLASRGFADQVTAHDECGRAVFGGQVIIPEGTTVSVQLDYVLPTSVQDADGYDLLVQQQPGVPPGSLSITVNRPTGPAVTIRRDNASGFHYHWRSADQSDPTLVDRPLPGSAPAGCGIQPSEAIPLARPTWLEIPKAGIAAPVIELGVDGAGAMETPPTPDVIGWYRTSARAGQPGNSVFTGHVDWGTSTAVFWGLRYLEPDDPIIVRGEDGIDHHYVVQWNRRFARDDPSALALVRASTGSSLTLITCDGVYDRAARDYSDRRIVKAVLDES
jgi:sortase (surface protein transpeptidase)